MNDKPKLFVIQLGAIVALYAMVISLLLLAFSIINLLVPDVIDRYWDIRSSGMSARSAIAFLLVSTPTYLILTRLVNTARRADPLHAYIPLTRWLIYLSLFVGSVVLLGYVVGIILQFLNGELTVRFILKALVAAAIIGAAMTYYLYDARDYWLTREKELQRIGWGVLAFVVALILFSFTIIETPATVREITIDQQQVEDLRDVEWRIDETLRTTGLLPESIAELYTDGVAPEAPTGREPYTFEFTDEGYALCASFVVRDPEADESARPLPVRTDFFKGETYRIENFDNWTYEPGRYCFERTVTITDTPANEPE